MDIRILLKVLADILEEEAANDISGKLSEIASCIDQNNEDSFSRAQALRQELSVVFTNSRFNNYSQSLTTTLKSLKMSGFVGLYAEQKIEKYFTENTLELRRKLGQHLDEYKAKLEQASSLQTSSKNFGFEEYKFDKGFEIGFIIPNESNDLQELAKSLKYWDRFLVITSEIVGESVTPTYLTRINNGSFEFFILKAGGVAKVVEIVLHKILDLYERIQKIEKAKQDLISIKLDNQAKLLTLIESDKANLSKDFTDTTTKEIFEKYFKAKDRKNELKAQFGIVINVILRDIQKGTQIDIIPPQIEVGANAEERKANESVKSEAFQQIPRLKKLYSQEPSQKQLPFTVEIDETLLNESHLDSKNDTQKKPEN